MYNPKNVMDKLWDRTSFEVGGHWPLWRGWKNIEWPRKTDKGRTLTKTTTTLYLCLQVLFGEEW